MSAPRAGDFDSGRLWVPILSPLGGGATFPGALLAATALALALLAPAEVRAQACELEYGYPTGPVSSGSGAVTLDDGESESVSVSDVNEALNQGRNDIVITLEYSEPFGGTSTSEVRLIDTDAGTLLVPPAFSQGRLIEVECLEYATVADASDYLQEFGSSSSALYEDAYDDARSTVDQLRDDAVAVFDPQEGQSLVNEAEGGVAELEATWEALLEEAGGTEAPTPGDIVSAAAEVQRTAIVKPAGSALEEHFPEVHDAVQATENFVFDGEALLEQAEQNTAAVLDELQSLDQEYGASAAAAEALTVDMARDFPELDALARWKCPVSDIRLDAYLDHLQTLRGLLQQYLETYTTPDEAVAILQRNAPSQASLAPIQDAFKVTGAGCPDLAEIDESLADDLDRMQGHFEKVQQEVTAASRGIGRRARSLSGELGTLRERTETVLGNLETVAESQQRVIEATADLEASRVNLGLGTVPEARDVVPYLKHLLAEDWTRLLGAAAPAPSDIETSRERIARLQRKTRGLVQALRDRAAAHAELSLSIAGWEQQVEAVADAARRAPLRRPPAALERLIGQLTNPPRMRTSSRAVAEARTCVARVATAWTQALRAYEASVVSLLEEVIALRKQTISPELKEAMQATADAASQEVAADRATLVTAVAELKDAVTATSDQVDLLIETVDEGPGNASTPADIAAEVEEMLGATLRPGRRRLLERVASVKEALAEAGDVQRETTRTRIELAKTLARQGARSTQLPELMELRRTIQQQLEREDRFYADAEAAVGCAEEGGPLFSAAIADTPDRLDDFLASRAEALAGVVPAEIRNQVQSTLEAAETLEAELQLLADVLVADEVNSMAAALLEAEQARAEAIAALLPAPQPDAVEKTQAAVDAWEEVGSRAQNVQNALDDVAAAETELMSELDALETSLLAQGGELAGDAGGLVFTGLESDQLIAAKVAEAEELPALWADAGATLDSRLAAFGGTAVQAMVDDLEAIVGPGLEQLASDLDALDECFQEAEVHHAALGGSSLIDQVAQETVAGIQGEAADVIPHLQSLASPSLGTIQTLLGDLESIFQSAASLSQHLSSVSSDAHAEFQQQAGSTVSSLEDAAACVAERHASVAQQVANLEAELEDAAQDAGVTLEDL